MPGSEVWYWSAVRCSLRTPLHAAAFSGHADCLELLLSQGALVNTQDEAGCSVLMMSAAHGRAESLGRCCPLRHLSLLGGSSPYLFSRVRLWSPQRCSCSSLTST